uniref:TonB-dependent receptor n=1 Tax=candidate division WOR-3 bacterium TaxID=2052148 RepID=A0A7C4TCD3_UNCW3
MRKFSFFSLTLATFVFASGSGRIQGRVWDESNGEPLVGVNIVIEGTELGAATDENGTYLVPFVPVGVYQVTASYIGYNSVTQKNVVVTSNQTTNLNFKLSPSVIIMEPVVVVAEKPMVIRTSTQTTHTSSAEEIAKLPISTINQIVTLQAGVSTSELGTHIRGGRSSEIAYYVDGVLTKAPHYGQQALQINKEAVEEIGVITGGFDAEYGEALSGVINIVTREGGEKTSGNFRWTTDEIFNSDKLNFGYNQYEFSIGGGILQKSRLRYFLSGEAFLTDAHQEAKYKVPSPRFDYKAQGKLSYRLPNAKGKIIASGFFQREMFQYYADIWGELSMIYNLDHRAAELRKGYLASLTLNYMPTKNQVIEGKLGWTKNTRFYAVRDLEREKREGRKWYEDYIFKANHFPDILFDLPDTMVKCYLIDSLCDTTIEYHYQEFERYSARSLRRNPFGATGFFYTIGDDRMWRYFFNRDYQLSFSFTNAIGKVHEFKTGIDVIFQNVGWFDNNLPFYSIPFWDMYNKNPIKGAFYIQDRMDFEGIVTRVGLRFDYLDSKASGLKNPSDITDTTLIKASPKLRLSPRLGFSMPITERSKFRFNYGHFYQTPTAHDLYRSTEPEVVWLLLRRYNSVVGNPNLTVEKTVAYEIGYENQISEIFGFGIIAYYKDIYDLIQTQRIVAMPYPYYQVRNLDYGNVKGMEFTIKKRMVNYWSFDLSYTLQFAKGTASSAWQNYYRIYQEGPNPITGEYPLPRIDYWLDFDERHIVNSSLGFEIPTDFTIVPLQNVYSDFIFSYHSGFPYTPTDSKGNKLGDDNSARMPGYINVDANITKGISIQGVKLSLFVNLYNLFNTEQITAVYSTTGKPDTDGQEGSIRVSQFSTISLLSAYYTPQADYDHDGLNSPEELHSEYIKARIFYYNNPFHWKPGFKMRVGLTVKI